MLYQIGALTLRTNVLDVQDATLEVGADFAKHALVGTRQDYEFAGPSEDPVELSGQFLPFHLGGMSELELVKSLCTSGQAQFVMRGDGLVLGWHHLIKVRERHRHISELGVGYVVEHEIRMERCADAGQDVGADLIEAILSLFG